ncbi:helix-turn-helix domain-containing protein [Actinoallomurus rhizosphaericola]|uniref:helix-turn-helix domain-containing protein n=1 Tax=Actinoallomurus rhizosphaericola TaxID=2952536 RepID=UPI0020906816|nr:helix-turn-helix transcriptional regulator [Actinoallomurus rhizosphaericola]MCO5992089.1 helix-turn-helix transcriptional regulator [Actinoallomurus rhizosphaericola]
MTFTLRTALTTGPICTRRAREAWSSVKSGERDVMGRQTSPTLVTLGRLVRTYRDASGILQKDLANRLGYSDGWLSNLETGQLRPRSEQVASIEEKLNLPHGALMAVYDQLDNESLPGWFRPWIEEERRAEVLRSFGLTVIPGLLQTVDYVRALLQEDEAAVTARMERQAIRQRETPPALHFVIDEGVLYQERGGPKVMYDQLMALADAVSPRLTVQVVRSSMNPRSLGAFTIATVDGNDVAYVETAVRGIVTSSRDDLAALSEGWETIRAHAMPQHESIDFIRNIAEERWT